MIPGNANPRTGDAGARQIFDHHEPADHNSPQVCTQVAPADVIGDDLLALAHAVTAESETAEAPTLVPKPERTCEQCGQEFTPRGRSGGSAQKFCGSACRVAFHKSETQRSQRSQQTPASGEPKPQRNDQQTPSVTPAYPPLPKSTPEDVFDWSDDSLALIHQQPETAIYRNPRNGLVIRQRGDDPFDDDDRYVYITEANIADFLDMVTSVGRRR